MPVVRACLPQLLSVLILVLGLVPAGHVNASAATDPVLLRPPEVRALGESWQLQGGTRFRYWGFHAYDIQLWTQPGFEPDRFAAKPLALSLTYARQIKLADLVERTLVEMERQAPIGKQERQTWAQSFTRVWRDVKPGDRLTGVFQPPQRVRFYFNGQLTGTVEEAHMVPRFMGIWLGQSTSQPGLRDALLGLREHQGVVHGW